MTTLYELECEAWRLGREGNRREIERFTARSYTHAMIMSGRIKTRRNSDPSPMNSRSLNLSFYATVVILVAAPLAYWAGWL